MTEFGTRAALEAEKQHVIEAITLGFSSDPVARWIWPETDTYLTAMPKFISLFGGNALSEGTALIVDRYNAAALWLPPGVGSDDDGIAQVLGAYTRIEIAEEMAAFFDEMARYHPTDRPCWYLPMIAADPAHQGRGLGTAVLRAGLRQCDKEGAIAYLEASNPKCVSLYLRHGFEIMGEIQIGSSPAMYPMLRNAQ